jgi:hypothetical protein
MKSLGIAVFTALGLMQGTSGLAQSNDHLKDYAVKLPLSIAGDAGIQRLMLPAQALVAAQNSSYHDVRVINGQSQAVPIALGTVQQSRTEQSSIELAALPIRGVQPAHALDSDAWSLRVESGSGGARVIQLDKSGKPGQEQKIIGMLFDARLVKAPVVAIEPALELPPEQPVRVELQISRDLKAWRALADAVFYRAAVETASTPMRIELPSAELKDHYIRLTWSDALGGDLQLPVKSAKLITQTRTQASSRVKAALAASLLNPHDMVFGLPFATPVAAIRLQAVGNNVLLPVRISGRNDRNQPWAPVGSTVVYNLISAGKKQSNGALDLGGSTWREYRIEADKKTAGFGTAPSIELEFEPVQIVFVASGSPPFELVIGNTKAENAFLPVASLIPGYQAGAENNLPLAAVGGQTHVVNALSVPSNPVPVVQSKSAPAGVPARNWVLWAVLAGGALILALMAWTLMKQMKPTSPPPAD